jgi:hypothetical protein
VPLLQLLQLLVDAGADLTAQDALGRTALQVAIANGNTACVGFLALREWRIWLYGYTSRPKVWHVFPIYHACALNLHFDPFNKSLSVARGRDLLG